jgi:hypothetical protein
VIAYCPALAAVDLCGLWQRHLSLSRLMYDCMWEECMSWREGMQGQVAVTEMCRG